MADMNEKDHLEEKGGNGQRKDGFLSIFSRGQDQKGDLVSSSALDVHFDEDQNASFEMLWSRQAGDTLARDMPPGDTSKRLHVELDKKDKSRLGLMIFKVGERLFVVCAATDGVASRAGLLFGDEIVAINGEEVKALSSRDCVARLRANQITVLAVARQPHVTVHTVQRRTTDSKGSLEKIGCRIRHDHVVKVKSGSAAERAGVSVGKALVSVGNRNTVGVDGKMVKGWMKGERDLPMDFHMMDPKAYEILMRGVGRKIVAKYMFSY